MKIAHIVCTFPPHIGGMGQVVWDEAKALAERGHEVTVFTLAYQGASYSGQAQKFKVVRLRPFIKSGDAGCVPQLFFKLKNFDVVHLHYPWYGGAEWVFLAKKLRGQKYVVTYHMVAVPASMFKRMIQKVYDTLFAKAVLKNAEKVLVVDKLLSFRAQSRNPSHGQGISPLAATLGRNDNDERLIELPNPIDTNVFRPSDVRATDLGVPPEWESKPILLFVGNLMPVKRLDLLIEAMGQLAIPSSLVRQAQSASSDSREAQGGRGVLDVCLLVVGDGYDETRYKKMVQDKGLSSRVKFIGRIENKEKLAQYYNLATVTVVPSDAESFSLVAVESLACGTPVVASNIPGIRGRIDEGKDGLLFTQGSVNSLAEKIERMLAKSPEERKIMGEWGRQKVTNQYSLEWHVDQLEYIYQDVVKVKLLNC